MYPPCVAPPTEKNIHAVHEERIEDASKQKRGGELRRRSQYHNFGDCSAALALMSGLRSLRLWVSQTESVSFRPLCLSVSGGYYVNLLRVRGAGLLSRHRHPGPVHGHVLKGRWRYLEHDWVAEAGSYVFEPPGETHTLVVPEGCEEMITLFHVTGALLYFTATPQVPSSAPRTCSQSSRSPRRTTRASGSAPTTCSDSCGECGMNAAWLNFRVCLTLSHRLSVTRIRCPMLHTPHQKHCDFSFQLSGRAAADRTGRAASREPGTRRMPSQASQALFFALRPAPRAGSGAASYGCPILSTATGRRRCTLSTGVPSALRLIEAVRAAALRGEKASVDAAGAWNAGARGMAGSGLGVP